MNLPVFERTLNSCRTSNRGFALAEDLVSLPKRFRSNIVLRFLLVRLSGRQLLLESLG